MDSSLDHLNLLKEWKASKRIVAVTIESRESGKYSLNCRGVLAEASSSTIRVVGDGFGVEISLVAHALDWLPGNKNFEPILRIRADEFECILLPLRERDNKEV